MSALSYSGLTAAPKALDQVFPAGSTFRLAGNCQDVVAIDFTKGRMVIRDSATPANDFVGPIEDKLAISGALAPTTKGAYFDAANYAALATADFGYDPAGMTLYIKWRPNFDGHPASQAVLLSVDNSGSDRFAFYYPAGNPARFNYGDGAANNTMVYPASTVLDTSSEAVFGAGLDGGLLFDGAGTAATSKPNSAMAASTPANIQIGTSGSGLQPLNGWIESLVIVPRWYPRNWLFNSGVMWWVAATGRPFPDDRKDRIISAIGDSHTFSTALEAEEFYIASLASRFGSIWYWDNNGDSGDTTAEMMGRRHKLTDAGVPEILIIYGGINDGGGNTTVQAAPAPTTTTFNVAAGFGTRYAEGGWINIGGVSAQIASVAGESITLTAPLAGAPAAGTAVTVDTQKNLEALAAYADAQGIEHVLICGMHFLNWNAGGDTTAVERAAEAALRDIQEAAAANAGAKFVSFYDWMKQLILDGQYAAGDDLAWHVGIGDQHLNEVGESILADAIEAAIREEGWLD